MAKDSQLDPKEVRRRKAKGGHTMAESAPDGEGRNDKKQSGNRHKCGYFHCDNTDLSAATLFITSSAERTLSKVPLEISFITH